MIQSSREKKRDYDSEDLMQEESREGHSDLHIKKTKKAGQMSKSESESVKETL